MYKNIRILIGLLTFCCAPVVVEARQWSDSSGAYSIEADLVAFNEDSVIIQRADKELASIPIAELSAADRKYLESKEAIQTNSKRLNALQTWTTKSGLKVLGKIVDYARGEVIIQRRRGKIYVNDTAYKNLPGVYQTMVMRVVAYLESTEIPDLKALEKWVRSLGGQPRTYILEGVTIELENGDEYSVPFFLLADKDQQVLKPGFDAWMDDREDYQKRQEHAFELQSLSSAYHQNQEVDHRIAELNLNMQAIQAGLTSAWEVTLYPVDGNPNPPRWVIAMGRNSRDATIAALRENPGYVDGPVRKVSR